MEPSQSGDMAPALAPAAGLAPTIAQTFFPPYDEGDLDPTFAAFRQEVLAAVQARDWTVLQELMHHRVKHGPEYEDAKRYNLAYKWGLPGPESRFWAIAEKCLTWGGRYDKFGVFDAPGVAWPAGHASEDHVLAAGPEIPVFSNPGFEAPIIGWLSYNLVATFKHEHSDTHVCIKTPAGATGFVRRSDVWTHDEPHVYFKKVENIYWKIIAFVPPYTEDRMVEGPTSVWEEPLRPT